MTDLLGEALALVKAAAEADHEDWRGSLADRVEAWSIILAAARSWHTLTNPTDEVIGRVVWLLRELIEKAKRSATDPDWEGSLDATVWTLAVLDALTDTAEPESGPNTPGS